MTEFSESLVLYEPDVYRLTTSSSFLDLDMLRVGMGFLVLDRLETGCDFPGAHHTIRRRLWSSNRSTVSIA